VAGWLKERQVEHITLRDLYQGTRGRFERVDALKPAVALLLEHNCMAEVPPPPPRTGPGRRPSPVYFVNPWLYSQNPHNSYNSPLEGPEHSAAGNSGESEDCEHRAAPPREPVPAPDVSGNGRPARGIPREPVP
jgi:hypothetical protein